MAETSYTKRYKTYVYLDGVEYEAKISMNSDGEDTLDLEGTSGGEWDEDLDELLRNYTHLWIEEDEYHLTRDADGDIVAVVVVEIPRKDLILLMALAWRDHKTTAEEHVLQELEAKYKAKAELYKHPVANGGPYAGERG